MTDLKPRALTELLRLTNDPTTPLATPGTSKAKPYNRVAGYVASRKVHNKYGGHMVIYDREKGADWIENASHRWIVGHEPSGKKVQVTTRADAINLMKVCAGTKVREGSLAIELAGLAPGGTK